jgi:hypothetical protein
MAWMVSDWWSVCLAWLGDTQRRQARMCMDAALAPPGDPRQFYYLCSQLTKRGWAAPKALSMQRFELVKIEGGSPST